MDATTVLESSTDGEQLSRWDKLAAVVAVVLAAGYLVDPIQAVVATALSMVVDPLTMVLPFSAVLSGMGSTTAVVTTIAQRRLRNDERVRDLRERMETLQERVQDDDEVPEELQDELAGTWTAMLKAQFRPMIWSMLVTVPTFLYLRWAFAAPAAAVVPAVAVVPFVGPVALTATLVGPLKVWVAWYLGASLSTRLVVSRVADRIA